jgi:hypothetical protein
MKSIILRCMLRPVLNFRGFEEAPGGAGRHHRVPASSTESGARRLNHAAFAASLESLHVGIQK